jgi:hypothetical protein
MSTVIEITSCDYSNYSPLRALSVTQQPIIGRIYTVDCYGFVEGMNAAVSKDALGWWWEPIPNATGSPYSEYRKMFIRVRVIGEPNQDEGSFIDDYQSEYSDWSDDCVLDRTW